MVFPAMNAGLDANLPDWGNINDGSFRCLLLGNGFSINIWHNFSYLSLFEYAQTRAVEPALAANSVALFNEIGSVNFEDVLRILFHARLVDGQFGAPQTEEIGALYSNTKNALAAVINHVHVSYENVDVAAINAVMVEHSAIFTTNYDLIPYWSLMHANGRFRDYFWNDQGSFELNNVWVPGNVCTLHFLHGAVHLVQTPDGKTRKLTANGIDSLNNLFDLAHPERVPLFIAEGASELKMAKIRNNDYLRFAYDKLESNNHNLVVIGHSFNKEFDQHIVDAINASGAAKLAISIWPGESPADIVEFKARLLREFQGKQVIFFTSTSHPLGHPALNDQAG